MITRERVGTEIGLMTGRLKKSIVKSRDNITNAGSAVTKKTRRAVRQTDYYVHDNAWKMMGIAAGAAFVTGLLLSRLGERPMAFEEGMPVDADVPRKKEKSGSWELVHAAIPLALFAWKAFQSSRCARRTAAS